ncbi:rCG52754 [Rattus norvegicus]|uniref:RCG52754 n=1 Tax=Rattus norvegicus TaxID=10116 RepID=A6IQS4_RAT|nr:rCG52754 [Rattus norvegicus]
MPRSFFLQTHLRSKTLNL